MADRLKSLGDERSWDLKVPKERLMIGKCGSRGQVQRGKAVSSDPIPNTTEVVHYSQIYMLSALKLLHSRHKIVVAEEYVILGAINGHVYNQLVRN
jgi:hypothetical protein